MLLDNLYKISSDEEVEYSIIILEVKYMNNKDKACKYYNKNKGKIKEEDRPLYHFSPDIGWLNDPNGFCFYKGEYHLFYQYNPYDIKWGPMHWGHAKTDDFVKWDRMPVALAPDDEIKGQCFSGSCLIEDDKQVLVYTTHEEEKKELGKVNVIEKQAIAIGDGVSYQSIDNKAVIDNNLLPPYFVSSDFRDPKIWKEDDTYYVVTVVKKKDGLGAVVLFLSKNLYAWEYKGILYENSGKYGKMWECPDFFKLGDKYVLIVSTMEMQAKGREYFNGHQVIYFVGTYDKDNYKFIPDGEGITLDYGFDYYATQTLEKDGKRLSIAWLHDWSNNIVPEDSMWCGQMIYPRELELKEGKIYQKPSEYLEKYYNESYSKCFNLSFNEEFEDEKFNSRTARFDINFDATSKGRAKIFLASNEIYNSYIKIDFNKKTLKFSRRFSGLAKDVIDERKIDIETTGLELSILIDRFSIEVFVNGGEKVLSSRIHTPFNADKFRISASDRLRGEVKIKKIYT